MHEGSRKHPRETLVEISIEYVSWRDFKRLVVKIRYVDRGLASTGSKYLSWLRTLRSSDTGKLDRFQNSSLPLEGRDDLALVLRIKENHPLPKHLPLF